MSFRAVVFVSCVLLITCGQLQLHCVEANYTYGHSHVIPLTTHSQQLGPFPFSSSRPRPRSVSLSLSSLSSSSFHAQAHAHPLVAFADVTCSSITNCTQCYETSGCHWCRSQNSTTPNNCHAYASLYGCAIGANCPNDECTRKQPEWKGYGTPSKGVVGISIILGLLLLSSLGCLCFCLSYYTEKQSHQATDIQMDRIRTAVAAAGGGHAGGAGGIADDDTGHYVQLSSLTNPSHKRQSSHERAPSRPAIRSVESDESDDEVEQMYGDGLPTTQEEQKQQHGKQRLIEKKQKIQTRNVQVNSDDEILDLSSSFTPPQRSRCSRYCLRFVYTIIVIGMLGIIVGMVVGILFYPQIPQYSMCTRTIQWNTILTYMYKQWSLTTDVDMQFAVYNPNRFDVRVNEAKASISYQGTSFLTGSLYDYDFPAGSITDVVVTGQFTPASLNIAASLYQAQSSNTLLIDIHMEFHTSESIWNYTFYQYNTTLKIEDVDTSIPDEKQYCVCKEMT